MNRRTFVQTLGCAAAAAGASAADTRPAQGIRLGFDTYSIRALGWKDIQLIDYAAKLKLDTLQLSSLDNYTSLDPEHLKQVRAHAESLGMQLDTGIGCVCPVSKSWSARNGSAEEYVVKGLTVAKTLGAHSMRCFRCSGSRLV